MPIPEPTTVWDLPTRHVGQKVWVFDRIDSTNSLALALGHDPAHHGLALLARQQSAGRGQYGRSWQSPPGSSVLMSLVLTPPAHLRRPALLTAWAAVSVCALVRQSTSLQPTIKWPNDVLVAGKKVCGILIEQRSTPGRISVTAVGIGLNVRQPADLFTEGGLPDAGSLFSISGQLLDSDDVARLLLTRLDDFYAPLHEGDTALLESLWREGLALLGREVAVELATGLVEGKLVHLSFAGVEVETSGQRVRLVPEVIRHLHAK